MLSKKVLELSKQHSVIRDIFEFGMERAKEVGAENVFDFSIGNPSVPAPKEVDETAMKYIESGDPVAVHGYTSNAGIFEVRDAVAKSLNKRFDTAYSADNIFMTIGAAAAVGICFKSLVDGPEDEIITFAPYFPEYQVYAEGAGCKLTVIPAETETFQIDFERLKSAINVHTKAVLINSPNNPSGAVYSRETIQRLAELLTEKQKETGHSIYIISDEPYREIVYDGIELPHVPKYYDNTLVCYSFSKSLSIPGERIGYIIAPCEAEDYADLLPVFRKAAFLCECARFISEGSRRLC